ncbi:methylaspartate mutase [Actinophytocola sp.]|uniref:methylaspartate mutase n=1 Tax=Actinophytocola sp. TaxID=1872138 RepID=UPI002ED64F03
MNGSFGEFVAHAARDGALVVQPRMGMSDPARMRAGLLATRATDVRAAGTITLDSFTRVGEHDSVRTALTKGKQLNGYPIVDHPVAVTRKVLAGVCGPDFPVQVRHGSPRPQRIIAALVAARLHATEGGPISYCLPYSRVPVAESVRAWTESARMLAALREQGQRPHLETFGGCMMAQLCPPALLVAISVLEAVFFRRHGVDSVSLSYAQQTHPGQDAEALGALRALAEEFLPNTDWHVVLYTYMGAFPRTPAGSVALLEEAARLSVRGGASRLIVKTVAEAHRIPTIAENVDALLVASRAADRERHAPTAHEPVEDTGIAGQARAIVEAVLDLDPDLDAGLTRAVRLGLLDIPYCLHPDNAGRTRATVDGAGRLQWTRTGALPLRGLAESTNHEPVTADRLLRSLSYVERRFDDAALEHTAGAPA